MKRILAGSAALILMAGMLTGCGKDSDSSDKNNNSTSDSGVAEDLEDAGKDIVTDAGDMVEDIVTDAGDIVDDVGDDLTGSDTDENVSREDHTDTTDQSAAD